jgi:hypothetical protein
MNTDDKTSFVPHSASNQSLLIIPIQEDNEHFKESNDHGPCSESTFD